MCPKCFSTNFIYLASLNFVTISHINYWDQVISWKIFWKFWNGPLCRNKSGPSPLLHVAAYWQSSNTKACAKKLSQLLTNNIDDWGRRVGLRIYVRYCRKKKLKKAKFWKHYGKMWSENVQASKNSAVKWNQTNEATK